jgi:hypothetical protein
MDPWIQVPERLVNGVPGSVAKTKKRTTLCGQGARKAGGPAGGGATPTPARGGGWGGLVPSLLAEAE